MSNNVPNQLLGGVLRFGGKVVHGRMVYFVEFGVMRFEGFDEKGAPKTVYDFSAENALEWDPGKNGTVIMVADPGGNGQFQIGEIQIESKEPLIVPGSSGLIVPKGGA